MKPSRIACFILVALPFFCQAQFTGEFAYPLWTPTTSHPTGGIMNGLPSFIRIIGPNGAEAGTTDFSITLAEAHVFNFDWNYITTDDPGFDYAYYVVNGQEYLLTDGNEPVMGHISVALAAGDEFQFRVYSSDGIGGSGQLGITNFLVSAPTPGSLCMLSIPAQEGENTIPATDVDFWYSYTVPNEEGKKLIIETQAEKEVMVYRGTCDILEFIDEGSAQAKIVELVPTEQLWIVWKAEGGDFTWTLSLEDSEPGDNCHIAVPASEGENLLPEADGKHWYSFTMPNLTHKRLVVESGAGLDVDIYFGTCEESTFHADGEGRLTVPNIPGQEIFIVWTNFESDEIPWTLSFENDGSTCEAAISATVGLNFTENAPRWFKYVMPKNGDISITAFDVFATNPDTWVYVYDGCGGNELASNDDFVFFQSHVLLSLQQGDEIIVFWDNTYSSEPFYWELDLELDQEIIFTPLEEKTVGMQSFELTATSTSGLPVSYLSSDPLVASVSGNIVTLHTTGTTVITASQAGDTDYAAASDVNQNLVVKTGQVISFESIPAKYVNSGNFALTASSDSGLPIAFQSSNPLVASVSGNSVIIHSAGSTTITATQPGNEIYVAATPVEQALVINKLPQQITFAALEPKLINSGNFDLSSSSDSGLPISFSSSNTNVATISGNTVSLLAAGTTTITASQAGNETYASAFVERVLTINKLTQQITFNPISAKSVTDAPFSLSPSSSSGLEVTLQSSNTSVATVSGNTITLVGGGTTTLTASQNGNDTYASAQIVEQQLTVNKMSQSITFGPLPEKHFNDAPFQINASSTSTLPITFESSNTSVASVSGNMVTILASGTTTIKASQGGNNQFEPAQQVERILTVGQGAQTITFDPLSDITLSNVPITLSASASSMLPVIYESSDASVATISQNIATIHGPGTLTITASQPGNQNYISAPAVQRTFCVKPVKPQINADFSIADAPVLTSSNAMGNQWYRDDLLIEGATAANYTVSAPGVYTLATTVKNCVSDFSDSYAVLITSIDEELSELNSYPNPAKDFMKVHGIREGSELAIYSSQGRKLAVQWSRVDHHSVRFDISELAPGTYMLLSNDRSRSRTLKFIKQ